MSDAPSWRDVLRADVETLPDRGKSGDVYMSMPIRAEMHELLLRRARERRISVASYVRRAALAMLAYDLGVPLVTLLAHEPRMARETGYPAPDPTGTVFGRWEIASLVGEGEDE